MSKINIMRVIKYLTPLWIGVVIYSLTALMIGKMGLMAHDALIHTRERQLANLDKLTGIHEELKGARDALKYDSDTIAVYARELGYGAEDERFIRIVGHETIRPQQITEGELLSVEESPFIDDTTLRVIAIGIAGVFFLFLAFTDLLKYLSGNR